MIRQRSWRADGQVVATGARKRNAGTAGKPQTNARFFHEGDFIDNGSIVMMNKMSFVKDFSRG